MKIFFLHYENFLPSVCNFRRFQAGFFRHPLPLKFVRLTCVILFRHKLKSGAAPL
jgi:hypothetical protein